MPVARRVRVVVTLLCAVFVRVGFDVGEGHSRPVVLAVVPMLLLAPPPSSRCWWSRRTVSPVYPTWCADACAPCACRCCSATRGSCSRPRCCSPRAGRRRRGRQTLLVAAALVAQSATDFVASSLRLCAALGVDPRDDLRAYAWTYLVDFLLAPIGLLAAWAADEEPFAPAARAAARRPAARCSRTSGADGWRTRSRCSG